MVRLGDIAEIVRGVTFKPDQVTNADDPEGVVCLRTKNVQSTLDISDLIYTPERAVKNAAQWVRPGDIVISSANSWNLVGKCSWVGTLDFQAAIGGFIVLMRTNSSEIHARYLYRWFSSHRVPPLVRSFGQKMTSISNLNLSRTLALEIPLPPLPELADSIFIDMFEWAKYRLGRRCFWSLLQSCKVA